MTAFTGSVFPLLFGRSGPWPRNRRCGLSRGIKKPAYGRLLVDDLALLLVSRNRLQLMTSLGW